MHHLVRSIYDELIRMIGKQWNFGDCSECTETNDNWCTTHLGTSRPSSTHSSTQSVTSSSSQITLGSLAFLGSGTCVLANCNLHCNLQHLQTVCGGLHSLCSLWDVVDTCIEQGYKRWRKRCQHA